MKRIFFFDVDNTLLDHRTHAVPQSALDAIAGLKQAGHTVVIATGRSYGHARPHIEDIPANYTITLNGACILKDGKVVQSRPLDRTALLDLFALMRDLGHAFGVNQGESCYVSAETPEAMIPLQGVRMPTQSHDPFYLREDVCQGWLFFDEGIDFWTAVGTAIIIASGGYIVLRERTPRVSGHTPVLATKSRFEAPTFPRISLMSRLFERRRQAE